MCHAMDALQAHQHVCRASGLSDGGLLASAAVQQLCSEQDCIFCRHAHPLAVHGHSLDAWGTLACRPPPRKQYGHQPRAALRLGGRRAQQTAKDARKDAGHSESEDEGGDEGIRRVEPGAAAAAAASAANAATAAANLAVRRPRRAPAPCTRRWRVGAREGRRCCGWPQQLVQSESKHKR